MERDLKLRDEIRERLMQMRDPKYREFQVKLIPNIAPETVVGVRTPELRSYAKELQKRPETEAFLEDLPHAFFDENQLHAFVISGIRDYERCIREVRRFLPYVDNWATCDQMSPAVFRRHKKELLEEIRGWIASGETYTVRFGIGMLMQHYLDEDYDPAYPEMAAGVRSEEYYVNMMVAWYFATALAKQYDSVIPYLEEGRLPVWTHNKAIQKAVESYRITQEQKEYLRGLRRRKSEPSAGE
ncbi:MAG: DNA alkylation repair protein [Lachnospiraceae bacterium]|nr:DNA alkylation repair protein [Lachnospiraceae bacterium]